MIQTKSMLAADSSDLKSYRLLTEALFCNLVLFNKRRVGELQRITLAEFTKYYDRPTISTDFEKILNESEKILYRSLKRVVVRGKRGRGVPVLFDRDSIESIEFLISLRKNFQFGDNPYLFGIPHTENPIGGTWTIRKHAKKALGNASKASLLTSTKMRKHLATIVQILKMEKNDLEQLAAFMGHTEKTHSEFYRLPADIYQTAKVSKILMMAKNNSIEKYKGKTLSEIQIDENLVEVDSDQDSDLEYEDQCNSQSASNDYAEPTDELNIQQNQRKGKRNLIPWTSEQKSLAETFFKNHINNKKPPKKCEVMSLIEKYPNVFSNRSWMVIKVYIQNKYTKQTKKSNSAH